METSRQNTGLKILLWFVYLILFLPVIIGWFEIEERPLEGTFNTQADPKLNSKTWFSGEYQSQADNYTASNFGLHNTIVRLRNELDFRLFKKSHVRYVVIGKDNYMYESGYIYSYFGHDYLGKEKIASILSKLKCVQDTLRKQGKLLLPVLAAGKASFFPEYFPDRFIGTNLQSNYKMYAQLLKEMNMDYIDFNRYFMEQKNKSAYPLYAKYGVHWSNYGAILAYDSLLQYIALKLNRNLRKVIIDSVEVSDSLRPPDNDILKTLDLYTALPKTKMAYPKYHVIGDSIKNKPKLLVIADSFWWYIYSTGLSVYSFEQRFWYYNEAMFPESVKEPHAVREHNYFKFIRESDVIVLLYTEATLHDFGSGFVDMVYETYCKKNPQREELQATKGGIRADSAWAVLVKAKALEKKITLDSMLTLEALFMIDAKKNPRQ